jgi:ribose-phosphate pyrophosphokinase
MTAVELTLLAGSSSGALVEAVARGLGVEVGRRTLHRFPDGELHVALDESVRGHDVYVLQSTARAVDAHVMELVLLADACRRAGAARLTAVVPYFGYARQDRRRQGREAVGAAAVARLIESAGFSRVVALDVHAPQVEGYFRIPLEHLSATSLLAAAVRPVAGSVLVAPDLGAVKLAGRYQVRLGLPVAVLHKTRTSGSEVELRGVIGEVRDLAPIIVDDMITTGGTVAAAVTGLLDAGCRPEVTVVATHALLVGPALARLAPLPIGRVVVSDTVDLPAGLPAVFEAVSVAPLLADAIGRLHTDRSLESLAVRF